MNQLRSIMVLNIGDGDRISYTYDKIDGTTGDPVERNVKGNFYAVDPELAGHINAIREFIKTKKLEM